MKYQQWLLTRNNLWVPKRPSRVVCSKQPGSMSLISSRDGRSISSTSQNRYRPLRPVRVVEIDDFRSSYFHPELPVLLPRQHFRDLPACERWFQTVPSSNGHDRRLNTAYLQEHGGDSFVPLELTQSPAETKAPGATVPGLNELSFRQFHAPLSLFLDWMRTAELQSQAMRLYLAQCQLLDLPPVLRDDFPTPELVLKAGKGDVYDTNVWIGHPPTYTPLHRDPNPNLFVQIAGRKVVRLLAPDAGQRVFASVRRQLGRSGDREAAAFRGEEMMQGQERTLLEQAVWEDADSDGTNNVQDEGYEAHLEAGDGLFIPKGWWHSIKGVGEGVTASVNWWFR
ncbi:clavaminate synthase-like protein [Aspergillus lentulus]|nr:clavaminate synthase-like protein [Aspergillus lentulus]